MKIVHVWNPKGGNGKSMCTINLAAATVELGKKPLVICQDPQGTSSLYARFGNLPFEVVSSIPKERPDADVIFFDHQAGDWEVPKGELLVMPTKPPRDQYATYKDAFVRAEKQNKRIVTIVTDTNNQRADERDTTKVLKKQGAFVIPSSGVFSRAASSYNTIFDEPLNKAYKVNERRREFLQIMTHILIENAREQ
ncbi:AAA family ATPase [Vibrio europaeus]|uniref:AAA family ATPase n=1 Tax=Vibrio europaeus TaxID=300876 RepID=UPI00233ECE0E|nr:AAA family ATPase [Vibrio europaeus]MDC5711134.1 AAA family ATPase [Vibrio europaeus]MDC5713163.1 AAA family ATPase [Vibrio europaeus]